jgi:hypothetical protein
VLVHSAAVAAGDRWWHNTTPVLSLLVRIESDEKCNVIQQATGGDRKAAPMYTKQCKALQAGSCNLDEQAILQAQVATSTLNLPQNTLIAKHCKQRAAR